MTSEAKRRVASNTSGIMASLFMSEICCRMRATLFGCVSNCSRTAERASTSSLFCVDSAMSVCGEEECESRLQRGDQARHEMQSTIMANVSGGPHDGGKGRRGHGVRRVEMKMSDRRAGMSPGEMGGGMTSFYSVIVVCSRASPTRLPCCIVYLGCSEGPGLRVIKRHQARSGTNDSSPFTRVAPPTCRVPCRFE
jgi:hypothetical protein